MTVNKERMLAAIDASMLATDLADYLVRKGVPFREAHGMAGVAVRVAAEQDVSLDELSLNEWQGIGPFDADVKAVFDPMKSVESRNAIGGTSPQSVKEQIQKAKSLIGVQ
jgi:argininosuccinate lyase